MSKTVKKPRAVADLESAMVRVVRARGSISRVELGRELKLVASTAGIYVDRLARSGYLIESESAPRGLGRPPVLMKLNPNGGRFIGVDFDARQIMTVAVDFTQEPLARVLRTIPARANTECVLTTIEEMIREVIGPKQTDVLGIGLGVPGPVDVERGISLDYDFIPDWRSVPILPRIAAAFPVPVFVENNLRSMALGEFWSGDGLGLRDLVCLGVRSGIGSGVIVDGKLLRGTNNLAGEIRRWACPEDVMPAPGAPANPTAARRPRTIEDVASVTAMLAEAGDRFTRRRKGALDSSGDPLTDLLDAAGAGDHLARSIVERAAAVHAWILHQLAVMFDPQRVVIAGPLVESGVYFDDLRRAMARLGCPTLDSAVVRSSLGPFAGALGAAALAFHHWRPRR